MFTERASASAQPGSVSIPPSAGSGTAGISPNRQHAWFRVGNSHMKGCVV